MVHETKIKVFKTGSGGWYDGEKEVEIKQTRITSKRTGKSIRLIGHVNDFSGKDVRNVLRSYDKTYKREFLKKTNKELKDDFE